MLDEFVLTAAGMPKALVSLSFQVCIARQLKALLGPCIQ